MPNSRFGYSVTKDSFKGLNIDCIQYSNIIRITHYSYSYSGTILIPNIIRIRIRPNICARILFVFVFAHSEKTNIIRIRIRSKFWFRILFVFVFGPKNSIRSPLKVVIGFYLYNAWFFPRKTTIAFNKAFPLSWKGNLTFGSVKLLLKPSWTGFWTKWSQTVRFFNCLCFTDVPGCPP